MDDFLKVIGGVLIALVLWLCLQKQEKDIALLLTLTVCLLVACIALKAMSPVLDFLRQLEAMGQLQDGILGILLKAVGIGMVSELAAMVCADAGNGSLEKTVRLLGTVTMLTVSLPIFQTLLTLIQELLGTV